MAETELIINTNLRTSSSSCVNCLSSETKGQNLSANGDFSSQLDGSLKELETDSGDVLPLDGKNLPQAIQQAPIQSEKIQPVALKEFSTNLQSLINGIELKDIGSNTLVEISQDLLNIDSSSLQEQVDLLPENAIQAISNLLLEVESSIEADIQDISEIVSQINEELIVTPISTNQTQLRPIHSVHADVLTPIAGVVDDQRTLSAVTTTVDVEITPNSNHSDILADELVKSSNPQKFDSTESAGDELNSFIAKYLSEDNSSKVNTKNQILSSEVFQQNLNLVKTDASQQNLNISNGVDAYNNLNTASLINRPIEAPIPLLIKQGVATEQIQQSVDQSIEQNVKWLISNKAQNAKINVFPESLGQVNIALNLEDSNLKLNFIATTNVTKDLIEASITALKSQFSESGINLQEVNVQTRFNNHTDQNSQFSSLKEDDSNSFSNGFDANNGNDSELSPLLHVNKPTSLYLLDAYV